MIFCLFDVCVCVCFSVCFKQERYPAVIIDRKGLGSMPEGLTLKRKISEGAYNIEIFNKGKMFRVCVSAKKYLVK